MASEDEIRYPVDRSGAWKGVLMMVALTMVCAFCYAFRTSVAAASEVSEGFVAVVSLAGAAIFAILLFAFLRRALSRQPYVVINSSGIYDNASGMWSGAGWISWDEVAEIRTSKYMGHPSVEIIPADLEGFMRRFNWLQRIDRTILGHPPVILRPPLLPLSTDELADQMRRYCRQRDSDGRL